MKAYSLYDEEVGYMQGLNFIAGLILLNIEEEEYAFIILIRLMEIDEWKRLYIDDTPKLFELAYEIKKYILIDLPKLSKHMLK